MKGYLTFDGTAGNDASMPDSAAVSVTGDLDLRVACAPSKWTGHPTTQVFIAKRQAAGSRSYALYLDAAGKLSLAWWESDNSSHILTSTAAVPYADNTKAWVRATLEVGGGAAGVAQAVFYTSTVGSSSWTQLGTAVDDTGGSAPSDIADNASEVSVGAYNSAASLMLTGKMYRAQIYDGIAGTLAFDADFTRLTAAEVAAGSFTESSVNAGTVSIDGADWAYVFTRGSLSHSIAGPGQLLRTGG